MASFLHEVTVSINCQVVTEACRSVASRDHSLALRVCTGIAFRLSGIRLSQNSHDNLKSTQFAPKSANFLINQFVESVTASYKEGLCRAENIVLRLVIGTYEQETVDGIGGA